MHALRRLASAIGITAGLYALGTWLFGSLTFAHGLIAITAIDHWHPYWPDTATVDAIATNLPILALIVAVFMLVIYIALGYVQRLTEPSVGAALPMGTAIASAGAAIYPYTPSRHGFHADLTGMLREAGLAPDKALEIADAAMLTADSDNPADWAGRVRREALNIAGFSGRFSQITSREPHLKETTRFLQDYGYQAVRLRRVGPSPASSDASDFNIDGLIVFHRTSASDAEAALIELLLTAHQAHMASMDDNGAPGKADTVERYAKALRHVCTKIALRGFVPPELDAEIGRDGTATAEELERWAVAQVVAICSPMTRMPLPTIERTTGGER